MIDYTSDMATIIDEWKERITVKSISKTINARGRGTKSEATVTTADVDIQPVTTKEESFMEELGLKKMATHIMYGYYNTSDVKIVVSTGDRIYDSSSNLYEVLHVREYSNAQLEIITRFVTGKV